MCEKGKQFVNFGHVNEEPKAARQHSFVSTGGPGALVVIRDSFPKKSSCFFGFCPNEGGRGPCPVPKFFVQFSQTVYIGSIWGWGGRGRPLPKLFGTLAFKKSGISCPN